MKRDNKNRPREMSSKKTVKRYRDVVGVSADKKNERHEPARKHVLTYLCLQTLQIVSAGPSIVRI